jgi:Ca2+-transporting ATPase
MILVHGALVAMVTLGTFWFRWRGSTDPAAVEHAQVMTFCVAAFSQLFFAIGCRSERRTAIEIGFFRNPALLAAVAISALLQVVAVTLPFTQPVFEVKTHLGHEWLLVVALALIPLAVIEAGKWLWSFKGTRYEEYAGVACGGFSMWRRRKRA